LTHIDCVDKGLSGEEIIGFEESELFFCELVQDIRHEDSLTESIMTDLESRIQRCCFFISGFCFLGSRFEFGLDLFEIRKHELRIDDTDVSESIDRSLDMDNICILEISQDLDNSIDFTDMRQEFVTQSSSFASAFDNTSNIHEFDIGRNDLFGLSYLR
jgi:hypothetical protein